MSRIRTVVCLTVCGAGLLWIAPLGAQETQDVEGELAAAEQRFSEAQHADPDSEGVGSDPLSVDPDLMIWTLVVFVILLIVLGKFAWGPIIEGLDRREQNIANHIAEAQRNHEAAKTLLAQYEQKLADAAGDVRELLEEARRDAEHTKQAIMAEAKAAADVERTRALHDIDEATNQALKSLAERSAELAVDLAGKILQSKLSAADHQRLIAEAMAKFPDTTPSAN